MGILREIFLVSEEICMGIFRNFMTILRVLLEFSEKFWQDIRIFYGFFIFEELYEDFSSHSRKNCLRSVLKFGEVRKYRKHLEICMCFSIKVYTNIQSCKIFTMNCVMGAWERFWYKLVKLNNIFDICL